MGISLALTDEALARTIEPGTPTPKARLALVSRLREAGLPCGVMAMPIIPWLTDSDEALESLFGCTVRRRSHRCQRRRSLPPPGHQGMVHAVAGAEHPGLVGKYRRLYVDRFLCG